VKTATFNHLGKTGSELKVTAAHRKTIDQKAQF
jgi:hypothetical protein